MMYVVYSIMLYVRWLQGAGTDDNTLIRVMVSRSEVDMMDIRAQFRRMFACSLFSMIKVHARKTSTRHTVAQVVAAVTTEAVKEFVFSHINVASLCFAWCRLHQSSINIYIEINVKKKNLIRLN